MVICKQNLYSNLNKAIFFKSNTVYLYCFTQILFRGKQAVGLELIHDGTKKTIMVKNEIILSAGAVGSPQILMLSGIGPKQHLVSHEVRMMTFHLSHLLYRFILHILYDI